MRDPSSQLQRETGQALPLGACQPCPDQPRAAQTGCRHALAHPLPTAVLVLRLCHLGTPTPGQDHRAWLPLPMQGLPLAKLLKYSYSYSYTRWAQTYTSCRQKQWYVRSGCGQGGSVCFKLANRPLMAHPSFPAAAARNWPLVRKSCTGGKWASESCIISPPCGQSVFHGSSGKNNSIPSARCPSGDVGPAGAMGWTQVIFKDSLREHCGASIAVCPL